MATYTPEELSGQGTPTEALTAGTEYIFTLLSSNILLGSAYFTFETVRNANGFYDPTSPTNAVGTLASASGVQNPIQSPYIFSEVINNITSSFTFTPTADVAVSSSYLRTTGGVSLDITPSGPAPTLFQMTVDTTRAGSASDTMVIPFSSAGTYAASIDWGDGNFSAAAAGNVSHTYASGGTYQITISGSFGGFYFNNGGDKLKLITIDQWGANIFEFMTNSFYGCANLTGGFTDAPNLGTLRSLPNTFNGCSSLNVDMNNWDVSNMTNLGATFFNCSSFNGNITSWDVSNVTNFVSMFFNASSFNQPLDSWNMASATETRYMFYNCSSFNQNLNSWNVSNSTTFERMFFGCTNFNGNISSWTPTSALNMSVMFYNCTNFNNNIGGWDVSSVTNMNSMFTNASAFDQDLGSWNVSNVTDFGNFMLGKTPSTFSAANLDAIYNGWSSRTVSTGETISFGTAKYTISSQAGRDILTGGTNLWNITDGGVIGVLDTYTGASAGYSLRNLKSTTTNVVKIRRSSDNAEQDFTAAQITDGTLLAFTGTGLTNDGFVTIWYDQSGNGNNATQTTANLQPKLVSAGSVILEGGKPTLEFTDNVLNATFSESQPLTSFHVRRYRSTGTYVGIGIDGRDYGYVGYMQSGQFKTYYGAALVHGTSNTTQGLWYSLANGTSSVAGLNGSTTTGNAGTRGGSALSIGAAATLYNAPMNSQELIIYDSNQSSNRSGIESNINTHYTIYTP